MDIRVLSFRSALYELAAWSLSAAEYMAEIGREGDPEYEVGPFCAMFMGSGMESMGALVVGVDDRSSW